MSSQIGGHNPQNKGKPGPKYNTVLRARLKVDVEL